MASNGNKNQLVRPEARQFIDKLKYEVAAELGIPDYGRMDKGNLPSRVNGYVGGNITKSLIALAQEVMATGNVSNMRITTEGKDYVQHMIDPAIASMVQQGSIGNQLH